MRVPSPIPLVLATTALCQCASGPSPQARYPLETGDQVVIVYDGGGTELSLQNVSSPQASQAPPAGRTAAKVAADVSMEGLLGRWQELGYFDAATTSVHPQAKASLTLTINQRRYVCSRMPLAMSSVAEVEQFNKFSIAFFTVFDHTQAYQSANLKAGDFYRENQRLQQNAREATSGRGDK